MPATAKKPDTLTAIYLEESHRWDTTAILRCEVRAEKKEPQRELTATEARAVSREEINQVMAGVCSRILDFADPLDDFGDEIVTVKAYDCEEGELETGFPYTFYGKWEEYTPKASKWNKKPETQLQFHARKWRKIRPYDKTGVIKWLKQCPGIKEGIARRLWNTYGPDAIQRVKESPAEVAGEVGGGFTEERAKMAAAHLIQNDALEAAFVDLASLIDGRGFPHTLPKKLVRDEGADAAQAIKKNPWLLLKYKSTGVARVDKLYLDLGGNPAAIKRQALILWHCLLNVSTGSTWVTEAAAAEMLRGRIAGAEVKFQKAVKLGVRSGLIATRWDGDMNRWLAEGKRARHEKYIAGKVASMLQEAGTCDWPDVAGMDLSDHQRERVAKIFASKCPLIILGGCPGTGKTYAAAQITKALRSSAAAYHIAAAAPTGKAAVRLSEVLDGYGIALRATTEHTLLGVAKSSETEGWGFQHDEKNPLDFQVIELDEQSMKDTDLMCAVLKAVSKGTRVILIGDIQQLPPVGHGAPLRDMILAGVPYAEFTEIRRNSGTVVRACKAIIDGTFSSFKFDERFQLEASEEDPDSPHNCKLVPTRNNAESVEKIVEFLHALKAKTIPVNLKKPDGDRRPINPVWDVQVIVATNGVRQGKSELSRFEINKRLQRELNPQGKQLTGSPFRDGDKIICLRNGWMPIVEDYSPHFDPEANLVDLDDSGEKVRVANGEIGRVMGQEEKIVYARFEAPLRVFKIPRGKQGDNGGDGGDGDDDSKTNTGCSFDLGFAVTAHKSQGSQFPIVLFGIDESNAARMVLCREAVYTILSRMQWFEVLFGKRHVLDSYCKRLALAPRKTFLAEEILEEAEELKRERK